MYVVKLFFYKQFFYIENIGKFAFFSKLPRYSVKNSAILFAFENFSIELYSGIIQTSATLFGCGSK